MAPRSTFVQIRTAADDLGESKQPVIRPVFKKVAPQLVKPFQKALSQVPTAARKKLLQTYFGKVNLNGGKATTRKNQKMLRDILVTALIRDRGFIEFVAEQILEGSAAELQQVLSVEKTAGARTASGAFTLLFDATVDPDGGHDGDNTKVTGDVKVALRQVNQSLNKALGRQVKIRTPDGWRDNSLHCEVDLNSIDDVKKLNGVFDSDGRFEASDADFTSIDNAMIDVGNENLQFGLDLNHWIDDQDDQAKSASARTAAGHNVNELYFGTMWVCDYHGGKKGHFKRKDVITDPKGEPKETKEGWWIRPEGNSGWGDLDGMGWKGPYKTREQAEKQAKPGRPIYDRSVRKRMSSARTASFTAAIYEGKYPTLDEIEAADPKFPIRETIGGNSDVHYRLEAVAEKLGFADGSNLMIDDADQLSELFDALHDEAEEHAQAQDELLASDAKAEDTDVDEYVDSNYNDYHSDDHEPAAILASYAGIA